MKRTILALAIGAALFVGGPARANIQLTYDQCIQANLAPVERVKYCKVALREGPGDKEERAARNYSLAEAYRLAGDYAQAEAVLTAEIALDPHSDLLLIGRSIVYAEDGKYDLAKTDADLAIQLESKDYVGLSNRCWVRAIAGRDLDGAVADCKQALEQHSKAWIVDSLGFVDFKRGDLKAALDDYNWALSVSPVQWSSLYMRGIVKRQMGDTEGGDADIARAVEHSNYLGQEFAGYGVPQPPVKTAAQ